MKRFIGYSLIIFICLFPFYSEDTDNPYYSIALASGIEYPINTDFDLLRLGINVNLENELTIPSLSWLKARADLTYSILPVQAETSLSLFSLGIGPSFSLELTPRFVIDLFALGGGYYGFFNHNLINSDGLAYENQQGGGFYFTAGANIALYLSPGLSLGLDAGYVNYTGLSQGLRASLEVALHLDGFKQKVQYNSINFDNIFPSRYKYYDSNPAGAVSFTNEERFPAGEVSISVYVDQYMENPSVTWGPESLLPGETFEIGPNILFSNSVLDLTEATKVTAEITIHYLINGKAREKTVFETISLQNRNAMTWDDDRKAAVFVSPTSPDILMFSKGVAGLVRERGPKTVNQNIRMAMGLFEALSEYGLSYVIDPNTLPYKDAAQNIYSVDFLQYPVETLAYKGGDCDDLTILYCSLLESIGISTAFITVPGHIYSAFSLDMHPDEAKRLFSNSDELIFIGNETWIPVESTLISSGFYKAWQTGAKQWRENFEKGNTELLPMSQSWSTYEASGSPEVDFQAVLPEKDKITQSFEAELYAFIDRELYPQINRLQGRIRDSRKPETLKNRMGILYARYGRINEAVSIFREILSEKEFLPALLNLGNIYFIQEQYDDALNMYSRAEKIDAENPQVLISLAKINYELSNPALVNSYYVRASRLKPEMGRQFSYLASDSINESSTRAEDAEREKIHVLWLDTDDEE